MSYFSGTLSLYFPLRLTGQLSDSSVCYDQIIQQEPGELTYRQGLLQCRLELGELQSAMDLANGMIAER